MIGVGALAAAALPPGPGFVAEWLLLQSLLHGLGADGVLALVQRVIVSPGVSGRRRRRREIILAPGKDMSHRNVAHTTSA